jgi:carboxypeptidase C (cathepsin A)
MAGGAAVLDSTGPEQRGNAAYNPRMRNLLSLALAAVCAAVPFAQQDLAQTSAIVTTQHQVTIGGVVRRYTARAGTIPIRDNETGDVHANMFFMAYTLDRAAGAPARPLTFLWNGGPGSNSGLVHLLGFGPRRITAATGAMPKYSPAGTALVDNQETWLRFSDLVFVDPIGTGYSRPVKPEYAAEFYQSPGDAESVAEFIRVCRLRLDAFESPIYLMGESYGVTRASLVAEALTRRRTKVAGVLLLSGGFPMEGDVPAPMRNALSLPIWTAAAYHHKKLAPDLQQGSIDLALGVARVYAEGEYASALARADALTPVERDAVVGRLARFTGLPLSQINAKTLRVTTEQMSTTLLGQDLMVGRYDSRAVGPRDKSGGPYDPTTDPSLKDILDATSVLRYLREELGYRSDLQYQGPFGGGYPPPTALRGDWMSVRWNRSIASPSGLSAALAADPDLRVFHACGYFDLLGGCYASDYAARHVAPALAPRITSRVYAGGHATYEDDGPRRQLQADVAQFIQGGTRR